MAGLSMTVYARSAALPATATQKRMAHLVRVRVAVRVRVRFRVGLGLEEGGPRCARVAASVEVLVRAQAVGCAKVGHDRAPVPQHREETVRGELQRAW
eukprot:scaffold26089_cov45-Phaeocystis_antarctica.AAC.1